MKLKKLAWLVLIAVAVPTVKGQTTSGNLTVSVAPFRVTMECKSAGPDPEDLYDCELRDGATLDAVVRVMARQLQQAQQERNIAIRKCLQHCFPKDDQPKKPKQSHFETNALMLANATITFWDVRNTQANKQAPPGWKFKELDPLARPLVAHPAAAYGAAVGEVIGLRLLGEKMKKSEGWPRKVWWVPQIAAIGLHFAAIRITTQPWKHHG